MTALVVMNCPPPWVLVEHLVRSPRQLRKSWYVFFFQLPVLPEKFVAANMPKTLVAGSYNREPWNRETLTPYADAFATEADARGPVNWYRGALRGALRGRNKPVTRINAPVLIIWGVHDAFLGQELVSPLGTAFYSRGRFTLDGEAVEEAKIFSLHPDGDRILTLRYRYPAGVDSSVRVQQLFDVLGTIEGL